MALFLFGIMSGCATVEFDQSLATTNKLATDFTQGDLQLVQTKAQRNEMDKVAGEILKKPISQNDAVKLTLVNSPTMQAMLAQNWADSAKAAQTGRIANPTFIFERLVASNELEIGRLLVIGLLDLLTLPQRYSIAQRQIEYTQLRLVSNVIDQITQVRQTWVKAVAAQQNLVYAQQVNDAAQAGAELARRLQSVGNFNKLQRARQQAFYADAATQLATAQHAAMSAREELIRSLGLTDTQAQVLKLPDRLPDLPKEARSPTDVSKAASAERLDIKMAQMDLEAASKAQGLTMVTSFTDIELGLRYDTIFDDAQGVSTSKKGFEISVRLPVFDWGDAQRDAMNAQTLAAANRLESTVRAAGSHLRESYSAYRTAFDVARHYRDEVVPLRKAISEENLLLYNGMLIGVFELLADSRDQIHSVMAAINAEQQFWLADAALQATLMGKPTMVSPGGPSTGGTESSSARH
jgi:outer membrane protein TolC